MAAVFTEVKPLTGFFLQSGKRIQLVPNGYSRAITLRNAPYPIALRNFLFDAGTISLSVSNSMNGSLKIQGIKPGRTLLKFQKGNASAELLVVVVAPKYRTLTTWFLKDPRNATSINVPATNSPMTNQLNSIYWWQAGVWLSPGKVIDTSHTEVELFEDVDFGTPQQSGAKQTSIWQNLRLAALFEGTSDPDRHINIFFVKKWAARDKLEVCSGSTCVSGKDVLGTAGEKLGDNLTVIEQAVGVNLPFLAIAHELGHNLGAAHDTLNSNTLMDHYLAGNATRLSIDSIKGIHGLKNL